MDKKPLPFDGGATLSDTPNNFDWEKIQTLNDFLAEIESNSISVEDVPDDTLSRIVSSVEIDTRKRIADPLFCFSFNGHKIMPRGNVLNITGRQKNGKSQLLNILCAIALKKSKRHQFGGTATVGCIEAISPVDSVLWIDTEQGQYDIQQNNIRLFELMGLCTDPLQNPDLPNAADYGLHILSLRDYTPEKRRMIANAAIRLYDPDIVIIDGIRDLINDINDQTESLQVVTWAMGVAKERDCWCVIHQNPTGGDKIRGAIGTELMNKCGLTFQVKKETGMFSISVPTDGCRQDAGDKPVMFRYGAGGLLYPVMLSDLLQRIYAEIPSGKAELSTLTGKIAKVSGLKDTFVFPDIIKPALDDGLLSTYEGEKGKVFYNLNNDVDDDE